mmetsp:Transcript_40558/g.107511  ORF Transcript_40558/g.107511 Transcript_40558/m.107511 type:complete len:233 (-) Transcript_40558:9-707(-)
MFQSDTTPGSNALTFSMSSFPLPLDTQMPSSLSPLSTLQMNSRGRRITILSLPSRLSTGTRSSASPSTPFTTTMRSPTLTVTSGSRSECSLFHTSMGPCFSFETRIMFFTDSISNPTPLSTSFVTSTSNSPVSNSRPKLPTSSSRDVSGVESGACVVESSTLARSLNALCIGPSLEPDGTIWFRWGGCSVCSTTPAYSISSPCWQQQIKHFMYTMRKNGFVPSAGRRRKKGA